MVHEAADADGARTSAASGASSAAPPVANSRRDSRFMTRMRHHRYRDRAVDGNQHGPVPCHERHLGLSVSSLRKADQRPPMAC